ncbi:MAG TPA: glycosyltransferase family A protein [Candidatus Saccharimonadales bacterium]
MINNSSSNQLKLSLVIPAYNEQRQLKACLDSVASQTVIPFEVIVVNNGSTDKTKEVASSYSFVSVVDEPNRGIVYARTTGFDLAKGDIIGRIDADSVLPANWVEYILDFYTDPTNLDKAFTGGCYFYNVRLPHFAGWLQGQIAFRTNRLLLGHYILFGSNMALPKAMWESVKADACTNVEIHEDLDLSIHLHRNGYKICYLEPHHVGLLMRRVRSNQGELWGNLMMWPKTLKKHHLWTWVFGWLGALMLWLLLPIITIAEYIARLFGKPPLED